MVTEIMFAQIVVKHNTRLIVFINHNQNLMSQILYHCYTTFTGSLLEGS